MILINKSKLLGFTITLLAILTTGAISNAADTSPAPQTYADHYLDQAESIANFMETDEAWESDTIYPSHLPEDIQRKLKNKIDSDEPISAKKIAEHAKDPQYSHAELAKIISEAKATAEVSPLTRYFPANGEVSKNGKYVLYNVEKDKGFETDKNINLDGFKLIRVVDDPYGVRSVYQNKEGKQVMLVLKDKTIIPKYKPAKQISQIMRPDDSGALVIIRDEGEKFGIPKNLKSLSAMKDPIVFSSPDGDIRIDEPYLYKYSIVQHGEENIFKIQNKKGGIIVKVTVTKGGIIKENVNRQEAKYNPNNQVAVIPGEGVRPLKEYAKPDMDSKM
ncbi:MAG: hypothetical protein AABY27_04365, partial [Pseudomonadota bacterium]